MIGKKLDEREEFRKGERREWRGEELNEEEESELFIFLIWYFRCVEVKKKCCKKLKLLERDHISFLHDLVHSTVIAGTVEQASCNLPGILFAWLIWEFNTEEKKTPAQLNGARNRKIK